ncbi:hypothetical protein QBC36DRAFT_377781 [Triangularia setosa]|uniref:Uncharacterized protein n=1 Tax=Triangularia setosa TaxID=2587417 RepID=A0AAN6WC16_9PEZI|nr:hypothetical protein QBC36DRAFT_377781 [Podospora setosa]
MSIQEKESPSSRSTRPGSKYASRLPGQKRRAMSPEPPERPNTRARTAAKEARAEKQAPITGIYRPIRTAPTPKLILKRTTNPTLETVSKVVPKTLKEHIPQVQTPNTSAVGAQPSLRRRFVYQTPPKSLVTSSGARDSEYAKSVPRPRPPMTSFVNEIKPPNTWQRSRPSFPVPLRQTVRPLMPSSIMNPGGFQSKPPRDEHDAGCHASTGENTPSPDPDFKHPRPSSLTLGCRQFVQHEQEQIADIISGLLLPHDTLQHEATRKRSSTSTSTNNTSKSRRLSSLRSNSHQPPLPSDQQTEANLLSRPDPTINPDLISPSSSTISPREPHIAT